MKKFYMTGLFILSVTVLVNAQSLTQLGVRYTGGKLNSVVNFKPDVLHYEVVLSSTKTGVPQIEATPAAGSGTTSVVQATSIDGTEEERTAKIVVSTDDNSVTYSVLFVKSKSFIEGFTEDSGAGSFLLEGGANVNHGMQLGNRSCRTSNNANAAWWTFSVPNAGKLIFYMTRDELGTSKLLSTLSIKKSKDGSTGWGALLNAVSSEYSFPAAGEWERVELDVNEPGEVFIQFGVTKTGTTRDFRIDDMEITPYDDGASISAQTSDKKLSAYAAQGKIYINGNDSKDRYEICSVAGGLLLKGEFTGTVSIPMEKGAYIVKTTSGASKVLVQ